MSFGFDSTIPATGHSPAQDYSPMRLNNLAANNILAVDHVTFNSNTNGGTHLQVTYSSENLPVLPTDPVSIAFTGNATTGTLQTLASSTSASSIAQNFYRNASSIFPLSIVRAFARIDLSPGATLINSFNISSVSGNVSSVTVNLVSGCVTGTSYLPIIILNAQSTGVGSTANAVKYTIVSATQFTITSSSVNGLSYSVIILQV